MTKPDGVSSARRASDHIIFYGDEMAIKDVTAERVRELLHYDPETGIFTHKVSRGGVSAGDIAGCLDSLGYVRISLGRGASRFAHRLAWLLVYGKWPDGDIDHIDQAKANNRIANLRDVSRSANNQNRDKPQRNNMFVGIKNIQRGSPNLPFRVRFKKDQRIVYDECFASLEQAIAARDAAVVQFHPYAPK